MKIKKWTLIDSVDVSPSPWFPVERRSYLLPNGKHVDDFTVTTLPDVGMVVPVTPDEKVVMVRQYKPGYDEVILEFPAGRKEEAHTDIVETAMHELEEETGIRADSLEFVGVFSGFVTKATEKIYCYYVENAEFNSKQNLDETEDIEVVCLSFTEIEELIQKNKINAAISVAAWDLVKRKFGGQYRSWKLNG